MNIQMTCSDSNGETHFGQLELAVENAAAGPPPNPLGRMADLAICLSGALELVVSDSEVRRLGPGDVIAMGDLSGKGHSTRVLVDSVTLFIQRIAH